MRVVQIVASLAFSGLATVAQAGETWIVKEGAQGQVQGVWQVERDHRSFTGNARMAFRNGAPLTYTLVGERRDGSFEFRRISPSDGANCTYLSTSVRDGTISGTTFCNGQTSMWLAVRSARDWGDEDNERNRELDRPDR